ncbi:MAG: T9SS type A sorting domain-containing protein, partial [Calditrichaeota bacterium]|nr:T9SS type A sorting domain-containing protein [Calditrichota bacterium]
AVIIEGLVATISYCDTFNVGPVIANRSAGIGTGMVGIDPQYADPSNGNFMLPNGTPLAGLASDGKTLGDLRWAPQTVGIGNDPGIEPATGFALFQNYPNPFNPETTIGYAIEKPGQVSLKIYAIDGSQVATIVDQFHAPGSYSVRWNAVNFASGVYVYQLKFRGKILSRKLLLLK